MSMPPRRWLGYALTLAGLSLLFDTYTFLRTAWSPLRIPMYAPDELLLGYLVAVLGVLLLFAPTLVSALENCAPDASMLMGAGLAQDSVETRRRRRLPLKRKSVTLPNRGLVGGVMILLLLPLVLLMVIEHDRAKGIFVRLSPLHHSGPDEFCLAGPIIVTVKQHKLSGQIFVNGTEVSPEGLGLALKSKLAALANRQVFVEGDDPLVFADLMYAIDVVNALHAKPVILTPALKRQMAHMCPPRWAHVETAASAVPRRRSPAATEQRPIHSNRVPQGAR